MRIRKNIQRNPQRYVSFLGYKKDHKFMKIGCTKLREIIWWISLDIFDICLRFSLYFIILYVVKWIMKELLIILNINEKT